MSRLPVPSDLGALMERLRIEEKSVISRLASLEDRLRRFEDFEKPAYESWIHLEFGPQLQTIDEVLQRIRERRILARRVNDLMESRALGPREALYVAMGLGAGEGASTRKDKGGGWDPDEVDARRRAKLDAKREARREAKKEKKEKKREAAPAATKASVGAEGARRKILTLYRMLARRLHPDSTDGESSLPEPRVRTLWLETQQAYESSDLDRLLAISSWLEGLSPGAVLAGRAPTLSERYERLNSLSRARSKLEKTLSGLEGHPAWEFSRVRGGGERRKLRRTASLEIDQKLALAQEALASLEDYIDSIGSPRKPKGL